MGNEDGGWGYLWTGVKDMEGSARRETEIMSTRVIELSLHNVIELLSFMKADYTGSGEREANNEARRLSAIGRNIECRPR